MLNACSKEAPRVRNLTNLNLHFLFTDGASKDAHRTATHVRSPFTLQPFTYLRARPRCAALEKVLSFRGSHMSSDVCL